MMQKDYYQILIILPRGKQNKKSVKTKKGCG